MITTRQDLEAALAANLEYSQSLQQQIAKLQHELLLNLDKQRLLQTEHRMKLFESFSTGKRCAEIRREKHFGAPFFMIMLKCLNKGYGDFEINIPTDNPDIKYWRKKSKIHVAQDQKHKFLVDSVPIFHHSRKMSKIEKNIIIQSARCEYIERAKAILMKEKNAKQSLNVAEQNQLHTELMRLDESNPIEIDENLLNWKHISTYFINRHKSKLSDDITMVRYRKPTEYEKIWKNYCLSDNSSWNEHEIEVLEEIVEKYKGFNWVQIHKEFDERLEGNKRGMIGILRHYQQHVNKVQVKHDWTRLDDEILIQTSKEFGEQDFMSQSFYLDRRLPAQCACRLNSATGSSDLEWTRKQDLQLILLVTSKKRIKQAQAGKFVIHRNDMQCRERWKHCLENICVDKAEKLNLCQVVFIIELLMRDMTEQKLWSNWTDITYVLSWYEYNQWMKIYKIEQKREKERKKLKKHGRRGKKAGWELRALKKDKLENHKYVNPEMIARFLCIVFGADGGRLFYVLGFCRKLLELLKGIKKIAMECQNNVYIDDDIEQEDRQRIEDEKKKVEMMINNEMFIFDALISDVIDTIYFDDGCASFRLYKSMFLDE